MKNVKFLFDQFVTITTFIVVVLGVLFLFVEDEYIPRYSFIKIIGCGLLSTLPSIVFISKNEYGVKGYIVRTIIHFVLLNIVVLVCGYLFDYYNTFSEGVMVFITILIVTIIVHATQFLFDKNEAAKINKVLEDISDKE